MKRLALLITLAVAIVSAGELRVSVGSYHINRDTEYHNEVNPGVELKTDSGFIVGSYLNSFKRNTTYAGYEYKYNRYGIAVGVARYEGFKLIGKHTYTPLARLTVDIGGFTIGFIPGDFKVNPGVFTLQLKIKGL